MKGAHSAIAGGSLGRWRCLTSLAVLMGFWVVVQPVHGQGPFLTAYNDCVYDAALNGTATDPNGQLVHYIGANVTTFGIGSGYGGPTSGELIDYTTGNPSGVSVMLTQNGAVNWQADVGPPWPGGYDTAVGTDARNTFGGIADMTGVIWYGSSGWWVEARFQGLHPAKRYTFATSASRAKANTDGAPGYADRWTIYTLWGAQGATNASTPGTQEYLGDPMAVWFNTGNNHDEGYVARWTGIVPGADGTFIVRAEAHPDSASGGLKAYAFDVLMIEEEAPGSGADDCANADPITSQGTFDFDNSAATTDGPEHVACLAFREQQIENDIWFCWTADCTGVVEIETCEGASIDSKIAVYNGCACPPTDAEVLACLDDSCGTQTRVTFPATAWQKYLIRLGTAPGAAGGTGTFTVTCLPAVYDFASGAGVDQFAYGTYTDSWAEDLEGQRGTCPEVCTEVDDVSGQPDAYDHLAFAEAQGGGETTRYINPDEGWEDESTLIAEFNIVADPAAVLRIDALWEGFGDANHHMEMYIWDYVVGNWGDGQGNYGENNFMDDGSGTADFLLRGTVTTDVGNYVSPTGEITLLIYDDAPTEDTFHDYLRVVITACQPHIIMQPQNVSVCEGQPAEFSILANGDGVLHYQWFKDGSPVGSDSPTFMMNNVETADDGAQITCELTDDCNVVTSEAATLTVNPWTATPIVVFSEIMYHPSSDAPGDEFLEIYNNCVSTINLEGWHIDGLMFTFGAGATIEPGQYLILTKDAARFQLTYGFAPDYIYTASLSNNGESLKLLDATSTIVDEVFYDDLPPWPVTPDGLGPSLELIDLEEDNNSPRNWRASIAPGGHSAGTINSVRGTGLPPWITDVQHGTALPDTPTTVTAAVQDATIVELTYLIDFGTTVRISMLDDGLSGDGAAGDGVYGATIPAQPLGTVIRYQVYSSGPIGYMGFPRADDTITYVGTYLEDTSITSALPIFHWLMDPNDYQAALDHGYNDDTELALLYYNGTLYDGVEVRIRGHSARAWPKKHWKFRFPQGHEFFAPGLIEIPVDQFNLQSGYSDKSYLREILAYETIQDSGQPYLTTFPVRVHQNGQFFGLYVYLEGMDNDYLDRNDVDQNGAWYKAFDDCRFRDVDSLLGFYEKKKRRDEDYTDLFDFLDGINNLSGEAQHDFILDNCDIPGMVNYLAANCIMHNNDHLAKNFFLYRDTEGTQRWVKHAWDVDLTFGRNYTDNLVLNDVIWADNDDVGVTGASPSHPLFGDSEHQKWDLKWNRVIDKLHEQPDIREMYFRRLRTLMDELLVDGRYEARIAELTPLIAPEAAMDVVEWGQYGESQTLTDAVDRITNPTTGYLARRRNHLFVTHRVAGEIPVAQSATPPVIINEIMYHPSGFLADEFIELYNPSTTEAVDMSGWRLQGVALTFPPGSVILPDDYLLVVENDVQFRSTYGSGLFVAAQYKGKLDNGGEPLILRDANGIVIDSLFYGDDPPWPVEPDGLGPSLELIDPTMDNSRVANWAASLASGGTPGAANSVAGTSPAIPDLFINELLPANVSINTDEQGDFDPWIEIYNASNATIDLSGMFLTDDYLVPTKWQIPAQTTLCGGRWLMVWADNEPGEGPLHAGFSLSPTGGSIGLYSSGSIIDFSNYGALADDTSLGRLPDGGLDWHEFAIVTPQAANNGDVSDLILNEYNAVAVDEFLKNNGTDTYWGTVLANGGDWFELVVTEDQLDIRQWQLVVSNDTGGPGETIQTLTLTNDGLWDCLRSGTIITISEELADDVSYDPANGDWWINVQASDSASGTYITNADFEVSNVNWQLTIKNASSQVVFGPAGEGVKPLGGIGNDEVFKLEQDPGAFIHPRSDYGDGTSSTFGSPNIYADGTATQDFTALRSGFEPCVGAGDCDDDDPCTVDDCVSLECTHTPVVPCYELSLNIFGAVPGPDHQACPGDQLTITLDVVGIQDPIDRVQVLMEYDPARLTLVSITPGDGAGSPWDVATEVFFSDDGGAIVYELALGGGTAADATVATLTLDVLDPAGDPDPTRVAFSLPCPPLQTELTTTTPETILPSVVDAGDILVHGNQPTIDTQPVSLAVCVGDDAVFTVSATGTGTLHYQWFQDALPVGTDSNTLTLTSVQPGDDGSQITCDVTDDCGVQSSSSATLSVHSGPPTIVIQPAGATACDGGDAVFTIAVDGAPPLAYQWYKDAAPVGTDSDTLTLVGVVLGDDGSQITCEVSHNCDGAPTTSDPATLTVLSNPGPPTIDTQPASAETCEGGEAVFTIGASGTPPLTYQWFKDGSPVGTDSTTLTLTNVLQTDDGAQITCDVSDLCGGPATSNPATLTVRLEGTGDVNGDGLVNGSDIDQFLDVLMNNPSGPPSQAFCAADLDGSGVVDLGDIILFVGALLGP